MKNIHENNCSRTEAEYTLFQCVFIQLSDCDFRKVGWIDN